MAPTTGIGRRGIDGFEKVRCRRFASAFVVAAYDMPATIRGFRKWYREHFQTSTIYRCSEQPIRKMLPTKPLNTQAKKSEGGFTLIEMMIVVAIISILATMAMPGFQRQLIRAKETSLRRSLFVMRDTIDQHFADHGRYPDILQDLMDKKYIRQLPRDPFTGRSDTWIIIPPEGFAEGNIYDVHSGSNIVSLAGTPYNEW